MKLAGPRALAYCDQPPASARIVLLFGTDGGLVSASADRLATQLVPDPDPLNIVRLNDDDLKRDPQRLADELVARSLMGGARLVRLRAERETSSKHILEIIADIESGALNPEAVWVIEGGELGKSSKLRAGIEASGAAMALQLYADDESAISDLAARRLSEAGVAIEPDALARFVAELPGDRRLALSELAKLELYALDLGRPVTRDEIEVLSSAEQARGADDAADAAIAGDLVQAAASTDRFLGAGGSPISAMRTLHFRLLRVADAVASGAGSGVRLRPPVYERDWPVFSRALRDWPAPKLQRAFTRLYEAERACKQAGAPTEAILVSLIQQVAQRSL